MKQTSSNSKQLEKDLQKDVIKWLKANKIYTLDLSKTGAWSGKGKPDLVICLNGRFIAFELKVGSNTMQPDQVIHRKRIIASGGEHYVPKTLDEFISIVERIKNDTKTSR